MTNRVLLLSLAQASLLSVECAAAMEREKISELRFTVDDDGNLGAPAEHLEIFGELIKSCAWHGEVRDFIATRKDANPKEGKDKYGDVPFADAKNKKYPIDTAEHIRAAWNYINKGANAGKYKPADVAAIKAKIVSAWKAKIDKAGPPSAQKNNADLGHSIEKVGMEWVVEDKDGNEISRHPTMEMAMSKVSELGGDPQAAARRTGMGPGEDEDDDEKSMALEHSNVVKGVEIFGAGTHNGDEYTEKDLDDMVDAFSKLDVRPALKVGHTKDKPGAPAYGWVENLRRVGTKLVADFSSMHDSVVAALRDRRYDRVSSEIYFNLKRGGQSFRRALKAVALLGVDVPAVAGLVPLHKIEFSEESGFESLASCEQSLEIPAAAMVDSLAERVGGLITLVKENGMNKDQIEKLKTKLATFEQQLAELKGKKGEDAKVKELEAQAAELSTQIKALEKADGEAEENGKLKARVATLEAEGRARELKERLAAISVPAFRPILRGFIEYALEHPEVKVKAYATKDGKETATEVQIPALVDSMVAEVNAQGKKLFQAYASAGNGGARPEGHENANPGEEVDRRVKEMREKDKKMSYEDAMVKVLADDQELAKRYEMERGSPQ